jgi:hypothetical protein
MPIHLYRKLLDDVVKEKNATFSGFVLTSFQRTEDLLALSKDMTIPTMIHCKKMA